ncbi:MAG: leucine-rich repeat domain-containing protein [Bacteroidota bacterium]
MEEFLQQLPKVDPESIWEDLIQKLDPSVRETVITAYQSLAVCLHRDDNIDFEFESERSAFDTEKQIIEFSERATWDAQYPGYFLEYLFEKEEIRIRGAVNVEHLQRGFPLMPKLEMIGLRDVPIADVEDLFAFFPVLCWLNIENCKIDKLPASSARHKKLETLHLEGNRLTDLPQEIVELTIDSIKLSGNHFTRIPKIIAHMPHLTSLSLENNRLAGRLNLSHLRDWRGEFLTVRNNSLTDITDLATNENLTWISIVANPITHFPTAIPGITSLGMEGSQVAGFSSAFAAENSMRRLSIEESPTVVDLADLAGLTHLEELRILAPNLENIGALAALKQLKRLKLGISGLKELPAAIFDLRNLEELRIFSTPLEYIPGPWDQLKKLRKLSLTYCQLHIIPDTLLQRNDIKDIDLSDNQFSEAHKAVIRRKLPQTWMW